MKHTDTAELAADLKRMSTHTALYNEYARTVLSQAADRLEALQAVVDRLPLTADGVPVVPGMDMSEFVFLQKDGGTAKFYESDGFDPPLFESFPGDTLTFQPYDWARVYSTQAAALAADAGKSPTDTAQ